jgi:DNA modification methylase
VPIKPVQMDLFGPFETLSSHQRKISPFQYKETFRKILNEDFDFHGEDSSYATHNFHAFPAKFPPQLPRKFIIGLTIPGERVLDPMSGSGTTVLEAMILGRHGIGIDIDPLALDLCKVKVTPLDLEKLIKKAKLIIERSSYVLQHKKDKLRSDLNSRFDPQTEKFVDYWFLKETQLELLALIQEIEGVSNPDLRRFFKIVLSSIVITKSGGVSLAYDLAHTRPHKLEDKTPRSAAEEFQKRLNKTIKDIDQLVWIKGRADILCNDAQMLGLADNSIDLIITSPPYASNAIDYMRAHKFSLIWFGYSIPLLSRLRRKYMGGERTKDYAMDALSDYSEGIVSRVTKKDAKKGNVLRRYYTEMSMCMSEMFRVLKPGKALIIVVGSALMRGIDTETAKCLGEIGKNTGFDLIDIGQRNLDRNRRMMPARNNREARSQIEERMHKEYVMGFLKPN